MPSIESTIFGATATSSAGNWPRAAAVAIDATRCHVCLTTVLGRQMPMHERSHVLECFERHNPGNDDRARQWPTPIVVRQNGTLLTQRNEHLDRKQAARSSNC